MLGVHTWILKFSCRQQNSCSSALKDRAHDRCLDFEPSFLLLITFDQDQSMDPLRHQSNLESLQIILLLRPLQEFVLKY
ncbi:unnamed protein product [Schistosoma margrebowiei]|uniref:Uncharacterized protein n=1 Tax=Schistosoma margrebowiei TaxID=48269 RepID=A0A183LGP0_9TREM|nr:unnamed protein product [Schistosoma margrebowiei]